MNKPVWSLFLAGCVPVLALYGDSRLDEIEKKLDQISYESVYGSRGAKMASAVPNKDGYGLYLFGDYLYWRSYINGLFSKSFCENESVISIQNLPPLPSVQSDSICADVTFNDIKYDFDSGYRVGIGYASAKYDSWDLRVEYTKFNNSASACFCCPCPELCPCEPDCLDPYVETQTFTVQTARISYDRCRDLKYDNVDVTLGSNFFVSKHLAFRPHFGGKGTWIDQRDQFQFADSSINVLLGCNQYDEPAPINGSTQDLVFCLNCGKNDFWGVGPLVGVESKWFLGKWVNLYALTQGALLFGKFEIDTNSNSSTTNNFFGDAENITSQTNTCASFCNTYDDFSIVPFFRIGVGLSGDYAFQDGKYFAELRIGYESQYYWRENYLGSFASVEELANSPGDVAFHGLVVGASIGF